VEEQIWLSALPAAKPTPNDKSNGWSAFGSYAFTPKISVFGRYDLIKPSRRLDPAMRDTAERR